MDKSGQIIFLPMNMVGRISDGMVKWLAGFSSFSVGVILYFLTTLLNFRAYYFSDWFLFFGLSILAVFFLTVSIFSIIDSKNKYRVGRFLFTIIGFFLGILLYRWLFL